MWLKLAVVFACKLTSCCQGSYVIGVHSTTFGGKLCLFQGCLLHIGTLKQFIQIDFHGNSSGIIDFLMDLGSIHTTNIQIAVNNMYCVSHYINQKSM